MIFMLCEEKGEVRICIHLNFYFCLRRFSILGEILAALRALPWTERHDSVSDMFLRSTAKAGSGSQGGAELKPNMPAV